MSARAVAALSLCASLGASAPAAEVAARATTFRVRVTGTGYTWRVEYPGPDGRPGTRDDVVGERHLRLPAHAHVRVELRSDDYAYGFYLPGFDVVDVAIPGTSASIELETDEPGTTPLLGNQMCGFTHPGLIGVVVVEDDRRSDGLVSSGGALPAR